MIHESQLKLMSSFLKLQSVIVSVSDNECPTAFVIIPVNMDEKKDVAVLTTGEASSRFGTISNMMTSLTAAAARLQENGAKAIIDMAVEKATEAREFRMHLVCERCYDPQTSDVWPVKITEPSKTVPKILPMARGCLKAARLANGVMKMGRLFGLPTPQIPDDWMEQAEQAVGNVEDKASGSLLDYACMDAIFKSGQESKDQQGDGEAASGVGGVPATKQETAAQVGYCLREFKRFLKEKDDKDTWCDLSRVILPGKNKTCWVCKCCKEVLQRGDSAKGEDPRKAVSDNEEAASSSAAKSGHKEEDRVSDSERSRTPSKLQEELRAVKAELLEAESKPNRRRTVNVAALKAQVAELQSESLALQATRIAEGKATQQDHMDKFLQESRRGGRAEADRPRQPCGVTSKDGGNPCKTM